MDEIQKQRHWRQMLFWAVVAGLVWLLEVLWQMYGMHASPLELAIIRGSALTGATLVSIVLCMSVLFLWLPRTARFWRVRRYLGVSAFAAMVLHVLFVESYAYQFSLTLLYYSFDPLKNPVVFGSIAFVIIAVMAATSSDVMVRVLHPRNWERIHRFVYLAYIALVFHFLLMNPRLYEDPAGMFLWILAAVTVVVRIVKFIADVLYKRIRGLGIIIGLALIILFFVLGYVILQRII